MKVEKDLREADGVQDERRNGKTGGNSARSFAVLTLCAVLAMVISLGTRTFAESEGGRVYAASDGGEALPMKRLLFLPGSQVWFQELRIRHYPEARLQGSEAPVSR